MVVYIGNFGKGNWAWPDCLANSTLAVMDDVRVHSFWINNDRAGYIEAAKKHLQLASGDLVTSGVASRWYNLNTILMETSSDLWIHREKDELWWTESLSSEPKSEVIDDPNPRTNSARIYVYHKPCSGWSDSNKRGLPLRWNALHPRAKEFLFTEGTFQKLSQDNAAYAKLLIEGGDLTEWHDRPDWKAKVERSKRYPVTYADARRKTIVRVINTVMATIAQSGETQLGIRKNKEFQFLNPLEFEKYIDQLLDAQEGVCALTELRLVLDSEDGDPELRCSLDRIDSDRHYERGNLQWVCKFVNRWKGSSDNDEFLRLVQKIRELPNS